GEILPRDRMLRVAVDPGGYVVPDVAAKLPGRGLWMCAEGSMIRAACAGDVFSRAARRKVRVPAFLAEQVEVLLRRRCLDLIGLARRAGELVGGFAKVRAHLRKNDVGLLLAASDGGEDGRAKVRVLAPGAVMVDLFDGAELGAATGRDRLVHAIVGRGRLAERLILDCGRLAGLVHGKEAGSRNRQAG
ncbi:MAG: DUF448 domain-containing protein, partial [Pseudomonadota bacterium]|nr:DUF448 domain-containing protein [Pseudomonadota bacterium]